MKYLIMEDFSGQPVPFIFPRRVNHVDMREQLPYGKVLSAGFIDLKAGKLCCHGGHAELKAEARVGDVDVIEEALRSNI